MAGYYRKLEPVFSQIVEPLTVLLRKNRKFLVMSEVECAVKKPERISTFDFVNASNEALGAVLFEKENYEDRPVEYASRKHTDAEKRYSAIEWELLGVAWEIQSVGLRSTLLPQHRAYLCYG